MTIATRFWTYTELKTKVENDLNLEDEVFITSAEMLGYANEAINDAEKIVHGIYEDYLLARGTVVLVSATSEYALPSGIYAHKIRAVMYNNGSRAYEITRVRDWRKFRIYTDNQLAVASGDVEYEYFVINETAGNPRILFSPAIAESGAYVTVWFLRSANRLVSGTDVLDIPEAADYVMQYMKVRCYEKEGNPNLSLAVPALAKERDDLEGVLAAMVPDANNEIEADLSFYREMN